MPCWGREPTACTRNGTASQKSWHLGTRHAGTRGEQERVGQAPPRASSLAVSLPRVLMGTTHCYLHLLTACLHSLLLQCWVLQRGDLHVRAQGTKVTGLGFYSSPKQREDGSGRKEAMSRPVLGTSACFFPSEGGVFCPLSQAAHLPHFPQTAPGFSWTLQQTPGSDCGAPGRVRQGWQGQRPEGGSAP